MRYLLDSPVGSQFYRQRKQTVEPVFAHTKHNRHIHRFHRRGRSAVRTEWRLILMTHNLTKLHRHLTPPPRPPDPRPAALPTTSPATTITTHPDLRDGLTKTRASAVRPQLQHHARPNRVPVEGRHRGDLDLA